jgi:hypothetical protein
MCVLILLYPHNIAVSSCYSICFHIGDGGRPCGAILYGDEPRLSDSCRTAKTPFTLGTYEDVLAKRRFLHVGALKSVRIFKVGLSRAQIAALFPAHAALPPTTADHYWGKSAGRLFEVRLCMRSVCVLSVHCGTCTDVSLQVLLYCVCSDKEAIAGALGGAASDALS